MGAVRGGRRIYIRIERSDESISRSTIDNLRISDSVLQFLRDAITYFSLDNNYYRLLVNCYSLLTERELLLVTARSSYRH